MNFQKGDLVRSTGPTSEFGEDEKKTCPRWDPVLRDHIIKDQILVEPGDTLIVEGLTNHPRGEWWHLRHLKSGTDVCWRWNGEGKENIFEKL